MLNTIKFESELASYFQIAFFFYRALVFREQNIFFFKETSFKQ